MIQILQISIAQNKAYSFLSHVKIIDMKSPFSNQIFLWPF